MEPTRARSSDGSQIADRLLGSLRDILNKVTFEVERSYQVNKLRVEIASARREHDRLLRKLGELVYQASQQDGDLKRKFQSEVRSVGRLDQRIAAKQSEIEELNARTAPEAGPARGSLDQRLEPRT